MSGPKRKDVEHYMRRWFVSFLQEDQITKDEMDHVTIMGNIRSSYKIGWKYEGKTPHGRPRCRGGSMKIDLK
jgi:hypothetical protein